MRKILLFVFSLFMALNTPVFGANLTCEWQAEVAGRTGGALGHYTKNGIAELLYCNPNLDNACPIYALHIDSSGLHQCISSTTSYHWKIISIDDIVSCPSDVSPDTKRQSYKNFTSNKKYDPFVIVYNKGKGQAITDPCKISKETLSTECTTSGGNWNANKCVCTNGNVNEWQFSACKQTQTPSTKAPIKGKEADIKLCQFIDSNWVNIYDKDSCIFVNKGKVTKEGNLYVVPESGTEDANQKMCFVAPKDCAKYKGMLTQAPAAEQEKGLTISVKVTGLDKKDRWKADYTIMNGNNLSTGEQTNESFTIKDVKPDTDIVFKCEGYDDYICKAKNDKSCQTIKMIQTKKAETIKVKGQVYYLKNSGRKQQTKTKITDDTITIQYTEGNQNKTTTTTDGQFSINVDPSTDIIASGTKYEQNQCKVSQKNSCKEIVLDRKPNSNTQTINGKIYSKSDPTKTLETIVTLDFQANQTAQRLTTSDGKFTIQVDANSSIKFSATGYNDLTCNLSDTVTCDNIVMVPTNTEHNEGDSCSDTNNHIKAGTWKQVDTNWVCFATECTDPNTYELKNGKCEPKTPQGTTETEQQEQQTETPELDEEKVEKAKQSQKEYELAREKEKAGRVNAGISTLATGLGGYAAVSSYFEQEADKKAEADMNEYLKGMNCNYSGGGVASLGETVEIPGGDELFDYYNQYRNLANNLKQTKAALNLTPGLEAQVVYENSNLYQYSSRTPRSGSTASLARALMDKDSEDATAWNAQKEESAKNLRTGALVAAGGLAFGISNRIALDKKYNKRFEKLREDFKKANEEFVAAHDGVKVTELETRITDLETLTTGQDETIQAQALQIQALQTQLAQNQIVDEDIAAEIAELTFNEQSIKFAPDEYQLNSDGQQALQDYATTVIIPALDDHADIKLNITVVGHTDKTGNETTNQTLSLNRANSVATELGKLLTNYTDRVSITPEGRGQTECNANGNQPDCRKIVITIKAQVPQEE